MAAVMKQPKALIPLKAWAEMAFPVKTPHKNTLLNWVHNGRITPAPEKVGKTWFVVPDAHYQGD
jgi:hypothetical protein